MFQDTQSIEQTAAKLAEAIAVEDDELATMDRELKKRKAALDESKEKLADMLTSAGVESIKLDNGLCPSVVRRTKFFKAAGVTDEDLHTWLRSQDLGAIIRETVHFGSLQSTMKAHVENGGDAPETVFQIKDERSIRMNGKSKFLASRGQ